MNFQGKNLILNFLNLSAAFLLLLVFSHCVSKEEEILPPDLLNDISNLSRVQDPDPVIEEPEYGGLFAPVLTLELLEEIATTSAGDELEPSSKEILEAIMANTKAIDPELKALVGNINDEFLLGVMDPENPLDPKLEEFLKKMLEIEKINLPLPVIREMEGSVALENISERKTNSRLGIVVEQLSAADLTNPCAYEVYREFSSGARGCGFIWDENRGMIESNYSRRLYEAEERFLLRNALIRDLYSQKFTLMATVMGEIGRTIKKVGNPEKVAEIKIQMGYFGLIYAYYIREHLSALHQKGLALNLLYYQNEVKLISDLRDQKLAEADVEFQECVDHINERIIEEVLRRCAGEDPVYTY